MRRNIFYILLVSILIFGCSNQAPTPKLTNFEFIEINNPSNIDTAINTTILPYRDSVNLAMDKVIGTSSTTLYSYKPDSPLSSFVADLLYNAGLKYLVNIGYINPKVIALVNVRGLRTPLPEGTIKIRNAYEIMPFENIMTAILLKGDQLQKFFDILAYENGDGISGATLTLTKDGPASIKVDNSDIIETEEYWVVTSDYLAEGGDGYSIFKEADTRIITSQTIRDIIIEGIETMTANNQLITPSKNIRITDER